VLWTVALLGILSIGVFIAPVALIAAAVAWHFYGKTGLLALPVAAAVTAVALLVPFLASGESEYGGSSVPPPSIQR
jgi:hypothetical protein